MVQPPMTRLGTAFAGSRCVWMTRASGYVAAACRARSGSRVTIAANDLQRDHLLVPLQCEFFALEGLSQLLKTVDQVRNSLNPRLTIHGVKELGGGEFTVAGDAVASNWAVAGALWQPLGLQAGHVQGGFHIINQARLDELA